MLIKNSEYNETKLRIEFVNTPDEKTMINRQIAAIANQINTLVY